MFFHQYPYTDAHELNLDWIIKVVLNLKSEMKDFISLNTIKYADPIQWNITKQYPANTVVIDPDSGTAYISIRTIPAGVDITNTGFWTVIFDLAPLISNINANLTLNDAGISSTATFASSQGDWLLWHKLLYEVVSPISVGSAYVENSNIERRTVEDFFDAVKTDIDSLMAEVGDLSDLITVDKTSVVNAINEAAAGAYYVKASNFDGATDTEILQNAVDGAERVILDRDYDISHILITSPTKLNLNGFTINATSVDSNAIDIARTNDVEIFGGTIINTVTSIASADPGACINFKNRIADNDPCILKNFAFHDLKLKANGAITFGILGGVENVDIYSIDFEAISGSTGELIAVNMEWAGTPHVLTYHPHDIRIKDISCTGYINAGSSAGSGVRISGGFNVSVENIKVINSYRAFLVFCGDYGGEAAVASYQKAVNRNITINNVVATDCIVSGDLVGKPLSDYPYCLISAKVSNVKATRSGYGTVSIGLRMRNTENCIIENYEAETMLQGFDVRGDNNLFINCLIHDIYTYGISIRGNDSVIDSCVIYDTNTAEDATEGIGTSGISLTSADRLKIVNCSIGYGATEHMIRSIRIPSGNTDNIVIGNALAMQGRDLGTTSIIDNNTNTFLS